MSLSGIAQFIIGFLLGIFILVGGSAATAYYFFTKLAVVPPKPIFPEEVPKDGSVAKQEGSQQKPDQNQPQPSTTPSQPAQPKLEPGAYKARVTWPEGLSLRDSPSLDANRIGGIAYNREIIIIKDSDDKKWQQIRIPESQQEGWVKAGNVRRVDN
ncbi:MAG: SH3 domain-containing protein [Coleofasciculaceae cyanobacterium]